MAARVAGDLWVKLDQYMQNVRNITLERGREALLDRDVIQSELGGPFNDQFAVWKEFVRGKGMPESQIRMLDEAFEDADTKPEL